MFHRLLPLITVLLSFGRKADSVTCRFYITVSQMTGHPDGFVRRMIGFNGTSPGPAITVNAGDRIIARVKNIDIADGTAMHWHGILQTLSNNMDGVVGVTQSKIMIGETFEYNFLVDDAGSFWYHAHFTTQYMQGARAALIVMDPLEKIYTNRIIMLADWYHDNENTLVATQYLIPASEGVEPSPYSAVIHGIGQNKTCIDKKNCRFAMTKASAFSGECGAYKTYDEILAAQQAKIKGLSTIPDNLKITRLKIVQSAGMAAFNFSIDGHSLWVLALDGQKVVPRNINDILINAGQRVDMAICRNSKTGPDSAWIRSIMNQDVFGQRTDTSGAMGLLSYSNIYDKYVDMSDPVTQSKGDYMVQVVKATPTMPYPSGLITNKFQNGTADPFSSEEGFKADTIALAAYYPPPAATLVIPLRIDFFANAKEVNVGHFDNISMVKDNGTSVPLLQQIAMGLPMKPMAMKMINYTSDNVVEMIINNWDGGEHPIHAHGHRVYVMARGKEGDGPFIVGRDELNEVDPVMRDTVTVAANSYIVVRFVDRNPGVWMLHCHINWHQAAGLSMLIHETPAVVEEAEEEPCTYFCKQSDYLTVGLSCAFVGLAFILVMSYVCLKAYMGKEAFSAAVTKTFSRTEEEPRTLQGTCPSV